MPRSFAYIVAISLLLIATDANAASCDEIANDKSRLACYDSAASCQSERSDVMRLACFDRAFGQAQPTPQTQSSVVSPVKGPIPAAPNVTVISPGTTAEEKVVKRPQIVSAQPIISDGAEPTVNESEFGLPDLRSSVKAKFIEATIVRVQTNANRIDYIKLDNGQVWREVEDGRLRFKKGQKVRIELGLFSTYKLQIVGRKLSVKVKRTK